MKCPPLQFPDYVSAFRDLRETFQRNAEFMRRNLPSGAIGPVIQTQHGIPVICAQGGAFRAPLLQFNSCGCFLLNLEEQSTNYE